MADAQQGKGHKSGESGKSRKSGDRKGHGCVPLKKFADYMPTVNSDASMNRVRAARAATVAIGAIELVMEVFLFEVVLEAEGDERDDHEEGAGGECGGGV